MIPGFFGDDLDALEIDTSPDSDYYFSVDLLSASNGFGTGGLADDILISQGAGGFATFAQGNLRMGLVNGDDLDALALFDLDEENGTRGVVDPGFDFALFSLSRFSSTVLGGGASSAAILFTNFTGTFSVWAPPTDIGLGENDDVNALDTLPEPGTLLLLGAGGYLMRVRRSRRQAIRRG